MLSLKRIGLMLAAGALTAACGGAGDDALPSLDGAGDPSWNEYDEDVTPDPPSDLSLIDAPEIYTEPEVALDAHDPRGAWVGDPDGAAIDLDRYGRQLARLTPGAPTASAADVSACAPDLRLDLLVYYEQDGSPLFDALQGAQGGGCARYLVAIPKRAASPSSPNAALQPRPVIHGAGILSRGPAFVPTAELHWGGHHTDEGQLFPGWHDVHVERTRLPQGGVSFTMKKLTTREELRAELSDRDSWRNKGRWFRVMMAESGWRPQLGDTWHINEVDSFWTRVPEELVALRALTNGLAEGEADYAAATDVDPRVAAASPEEKAEIEKAARATDVRGVVYVSSIGRRLPGETSDDAWQSALKNTLRKKQFWTDMSKYVQHFAIERYAAPAAACADGKDAASQAASLEDELFELEDFARRVHASNPSGLPTAFWFLRAHHTPVLNAAASTYPHVSEPEMEKFVAAQVHAARLYDLDGKRLGLYWKSPTLPPLRARALARRLTDALLGAYTTTAGADGACEKASGGCVCGAAGAGAGGGDPGDGVAGVGCKGLDDGWYCNPFITFTAFHCAGGSQDIYLSCSDSHATCVKDADGVHAKVDSGNLVCR